MARPAHGRHLGWHQAARPALHVPFGGAHGSNPTGSADVALLTTGNLQLVALAQQASLCHSLNTVFETTRGVVGTLMLTRRRERSGWDVSHTQDICVLHYSRVEIHESARRHGIDDETIEHVVAHAIVVADMDEHHDPPKVLVIGPDAAGNLLEVIVLELADDRTLAIHAMPLRPTFHALLPGQHDE